MVRALVEQMIKLVAALAFFNDLLVLKASRKTLLGWRNLITNLIWFSYESPLGTPSLAVHWQVTAGTYY